MIWPEKSENIVLLKISTATIAMETEKCIKPTLNFWGWSNMFTQQIWIKLVEV